MSQYRDRGVVLRTIRLGETDRIVTLLTEHHGKVRCVAKGVRRPGSRIGARVEPLTHVAFLGWQGRRDLDTLNQVEVVDTFRAVREDLERLQAAMTVLEVADQVAQERHGNPALYRMVLGVLGVLAERLPAMVVPAFFIKLLALEGLEPVLDACVSCGSEGPLVAFDMSSGGALCGTCRRGRPVSADALAAMRATLSGRLSDVLAEESSPTTDEVAVIMGEAMEAHLDRRLRSLHAGVV